VVNFVEFRAREVRRFCYPTDLSDGKWECLGLYVPAHNRGGRLITHSAREILSVIFCVLESGRPGSIVS
jgi:transposase